MIIFLPSYYQAPLLFRSGHLQSIYPTLFRRLPALGYTRERIETPDRDFLDLDWIFGGHRRLAVLSHGLEGCSSSQYILGMARVLSGEAWDVLAWNYRGCSGEVNRHLYGYHSGKTEDLDLVLKHVAEKGDYRDVVLVGFSVGGNITLKYLTEYSDSLVLPISCALALSSPVDLRSCALELAKRRNFVYMKYFLKKLRKSLEAKKILFPNDVDLSDFKRVKTFFDFDERYTAPLNGFLGAEDYWEKASSLPSLKEIRIPSLLINAKDDPFLGESCYPEEQARSSSFVHLEIPKHGGHVGFISGKPKGVYWSEKRSLEFISEFTSIE